MRFDFRRKAVTRHADAEKKIICPILPKAVDSSPVNRSCLFIGKVKTVERKAQPGPDGFEKAFFSAPEARKGGVRIFGREDGFLLPFCKISPDEPLVAFGKDLNIKPYRIIRQRTGGKVCGVRQAERIFMTDQMRLSVRVSPDL